MPGCCLPQYLDGAVADASGNPTLLCRGPGPWVAAVQRVRFSLKDARKPPFYKGLRACCPVLGYGAAGRATTHAESNTQQTRPVDQLMQVGRARNWSGDV